MTKAASFVLLAALSIPVISTSRSRGALVDVDEVRKNKNTRLTNLLGMAQPPTRAALFKDALNKGLLKRARPEIRDLYNILEVDFHPLSICKKITPILKQIGADPEMEKYVVPLQQVILTRLFQQLSQVYESVELKFVYELAQFPDPFQVTQSMIEKFIMNGCKKGDLAIRVDHVAGVLTFDSDIFSSAKALHPGSAAGSAESEVGFVQRLQSTPAEIARSQLTRLAKTLHVTCLYVDPSYTAARVQAKQLAHARALEGAAKEHEETLARRVIIEKKKEAATETLQRKQREEETRKRIRTQQLQEAEKQRLLDEHREREKKRIKDEQDRIRKQELKKQLDELSGVKGIDINEIDPEELDSNRLRAMKLAQLEKEKNELNDRIRITAKRIDHLERAFRREELKHIPEDYEKQKQHDMEVYELQKEETLKEAQQKHKADVALKHRLSRLVPSFTEFRDSLNEKRHEEFEKRRKAAERELEAKKKQRIKEFQERRRREKAEREEEERRKQEEEERIRREEEERAAHEEEQRRAMAERKAQREEERRKLDEIAAKQKQREEEAEARRAARRTGPPAPTAPEPVRAEPTERTAPRLNLAPRAGAGGASGWRERLAAKEAAGETAPAPTPAASTSAPAPVPAAEEAAALPRRTGGYVPPHQRQGASARPAAPPANGGGPPEKYIPRQLREGGAAPAPRPAPPAGSERSEESRPSGGKWVPNWKQRQQQQ